VRRRGSGGGPRSRYGERARQRQPRSRNGERARSRADLFRASSTCATVNGVSARPRPSLSFLEGRAGDAPPLCRGVLAEDASGRTLVTSANPTRLLLPGSGPGAEDRKKLSGKLRSGECLSIGDEGRARTVATGASGKLRSGECLSIGDEGRARTVARGACSYCRPKSGKLCSGECLSIGDDGRAPGARGECS
jgi:hypothetical protein